jgi:hypothetical protein
VAKKDDKKKKAATKDEAPASPWLKGVMGVKGVVPPGRRLSPPNEKRPNRWSASGVFGIRPPGNQKPGEGSADLGSEKLEKKRILREKAQAKAYAAAQSKKGAQVSVASGRPIRGARPEPFRDLADPADLKTFLDSITDFIKTIEPGEHSAEGLAELIQQSKAPYEITVAFAILSILVGKSASARRRYTAQLERGAKVFFNLSMRLDKNVKPPRGLAPETMDPIFFDLPPTAYQVPYAFGTAAFIRIFELLRRDEDTDEKLHDFARKLYARYIEKRSFGDKPLETLFPAHDLLDVADPDA